MTDEIRKKQQQEWIQTVTLTQEQVQHIINEKIARGRVYAGFVRHKTPPVAKICEKCQIETT